MDSPSVALALKHDVRHIKPPSLLLHNYNALPNHVTDSQTRSASLMTPAVGRTVANRKKNSKDDAEPRKYDVHPSKANKKPSKLDTVQSKQEMLFQLKRAAEENTKILERERAALHALEHQQPETFSVAHKAPGNAGYDDVWLQQSPERQQQQEQQQQQGWRHKEPPRAMKQPQREDPVHARLKSKNHLFINAPRKVFNASSVPGLSDPQQRLQEPASPFAVADSPAHSPGLNGTFPDTPSFFPGMVFSIPVHQEEVLPAQQSTTIQQQQQHQHQHQHQLSPGQTHGPQSSSVPASEDRQQARQPHRRAPHSSSPLGMPSSPGLQLGAAQPSDPQHSKRDQEQRQEAYRRELDEQVRQMQQLKAAEAAARRRQEEADAADAAAHFPPWDPRARAARRGGGGEPLRDKHGNTVADLRTAAKHGAAAQQEPAAVFASPPAGGSSGPEAADGSSFLTRHHHPQLMVQVPIPASDLVPLQPQQHAWHRGGAGNTLQPSPPHHSYDASYAQAQAHHMPTTSNLPHAIHSPRGSWADQWGGPSHVPALPMSNPNPNPNPAHGGPHSPSGGFGNGSSSPGGGSVSPGGGRRYMSYLNELRPGPSEEQRRHAELQRQKLQADLEEQVRQKKEREARRKAEDAAAEAKEETELQAYYSRMAAQREAEVRAVQAQARAASHQEASTSTSAPMVHQQPGLVQPSRAPGGGGAAARQCGGGPAPPPRGPRPHRAGKALVDASWLDQIDAANHAATAAAPMSSVVRFGRRATEGGEAGSEGASVEVRNSVVSQRSISAPNVIATWQHSNGRAPAKAEVASALQLLQAEQARLCEEFARQAAVVQQLASQVGQGGNKRGRAWQELNRVRALLDNDPSALHFEPPADDSLDQFVVSTHLLPREANTIPSRLTTPLEANWVGEREPMLVHNKPGPHQHATGGHASEPDLDAAYDAISQLHEELDERIRQSYSGPIVSVVHQDAGHPMSHMSHIPRPSMIPKPPSWAPMNQHRFNNTHDEEVGAYGSGGSGMSINKQPLQQPQSRQQQLQQKMVFGAPADHGMMDFRPSRLGPQQHMGRPPPSPAILRGDHLPSPTRVFRLNPAQQQGRSRQQQQQQQQQAPVSRKPPVPRRQQG